MELREQGEHFIRECKICLEEDTVENLISPCQCKGTHQHVHAECLNNWRRRFSRMHIHRHYCSVCKTHFQMNVSGYITNDTGEEGEHRIDIPQNNIRPPRHRSLQRQRLSWPQTLLHVSIQCFSCATLFAYFLVMIIEKPPSTVFTIVTSSPFTYANAWMIIHFVFCLIQTCCFAHFTSEPVHLLSGGGLITYALFFTPYILIVFNMTLLTTNSFYVCKRLPRR